MKILLIYPEYPETYWSFKHALKFIGKKAINIPLGILTVSALLPKDWQKKFVDLNVSKLTDVQIQWADMVFISAISIQSASVKEITERCKKFNKKIVGGGPYFTEYSEMHTTVDHVIMNEAEITLPMFISDLSTGKARKTYETNKYADIALSPLPDLSLVRLSKYAAATIQYSRGCPYDCEFCDITALFGRHVRTKKPEQIIAELDQLYYSGWRGSVFFVDDNFIGHKQNLKKVLLPSVIAWMKEKKYPFHYITEASINLADDLVLMEMMAEAGFNKVFVGIETPDETSLAECNKIQNSNRNLMASVKVIQQHGMEVTAGFIVGFDNDTSNIFQRQVDFIQGSGIITAMVGLLNAPRLSKLYKRLHGEGRITSQFTGDNTDYSINFIPKMDKEKLIGGYEKIIREIYSSKFYYARVKRFLNNYKPNIKEKMSINKLFAFFKSVLYLGIFMKQRKYYWKLLFWSILRKPGAFPLAVTYSIYGYHFKKVFRNIDE